MSTKWKLSTFSSRLLIQINWWEGLVKQFELNVLGHSSALWLGYPRTSCRRYRRAEASRTTTVTVTRKLGPPEVQGSSNYGDKDILESALLYIGRNIFWFWPLSQVSKLFQIIHYAQRNWRSFTSVNEKQHEEAISVLTRGPTAVLLLHNKEKDVLYRFSQLRSKPGTRPPFFC